MKYAGILKNSALVVAVAAIAIAIGSQVPRIMARANGPVKKGDYAVHVERQKYPLTLYGTSTCPACKNARAYLRQVGVPYKDLVIDQSESAATAFKQLKQRSVPILVSADQLVVGFQQEVYEDVVRSKTAH